MVKFAKNGQNNRQKATLIMGIYIDPTDIAWLNGSHRFLHILFKHADLLSGNIIS